MSATPLDLGLCEEDRRALAEARRKPRPVDRVAALGLISSASKLVETAVRQRPPLSGKPFTLPGHRETDGS